MRKSMFVIAIGTSLLAACNNDEVVMLTDQEKADLRFLREEEKLARDVYLFSFNKYGEEIFSNIASSEQSHMNAVLNLLNKYDVEDPVGVNAEGVFVNETLQQLYVQLTAQSDQSLNDALTVGATIEDLDIHDIEELLGHTSNADLLNVYDRLTCGSRNHMRSFVGQLGTYVPTYISQVEYDAIIASSNEQCGGN